MTTKWKRWLATLLCVAMLSGLVPAALAAEGISRGDASAVSTPVESDLEESADALPMDAPAADEDTAPNEAPAAPVWVDVSEDQAELMAETADGQQKKNLALGKTATASSVHPKNPGMTAAMAVDGDTTSTSSRWSSKRLGTVYQSGTTSDEYDENIEQWLKIDLGQNYNVDEVNLYWEGARAKTYKVQGSTDDSSYIDLVADGTTTAAGLKNHTFTAQNVRYIQVLCQTAQNNHWGYSLFEVEVFSSEVLDIVDPDAPVNLALERPVSFSTEQTGTGNSNNPAIHAVDGDNSTRWASSNDQFPQWIEVDLGQTCDITNFVCNFYNGGTPRAYQYKIEASKNGKDYQLLVDASENSSTGKIEHDAPANTQARFVRATFSGAKKTDGTAYPINSGFYEFEIYGPQPTTPLPGAKDNLALCDGVEATATSNEVAKFSPDKAVDGDATGDSRWAPDKTTDQREREESLTIDLGMLRSVQEIDIKFESEAHAYEVLVSEDGSDGSWVSVGKVKVETEGGKVNKTFLLEEPVVVQYVKYVQTEQWYSSGAKKYYGGSIYELEIYQEPLFSAATIVEGLKDTAPTIEDGKLVLPEMPNDNYTISLYGSDNQQIVTMDGTVNTPLVDMPVNVLYKVANKEIAHDVATSETDVKFTVPGQYQVEAGDNEKPNVVPGLREWKGGQGNFVLTDSSAIVLDAASASALADTAKLYQQYFDEMLGRDIAVKTGEAAAGDILLKLDDSLAYLGDEGYVLEADDVVTISASTTTGVLYGGITITQVLYQDETHTNFPKGTAHDYPKYEVRGGMLDVGRMYIPLEYVKEMALYMGWFKLNTLHMHINDYWGNSGYAAFRLESTKYPSIVAKDGHYTKAEYKQFQKDLAKYGIEVVTEIDSPYHAECFRGIEGITMKAAGQLEIRTDETYAASVQLIKNLMNEYLDGSDPVFQGGAYHIGTDEYDKGASEQMRKYTDELIKYSNSKGRETRVWASLGKNGFNGTTPVTNEATVNLWATYWADAKETYDAGFNVINTEGGWLYIVPRSNAGYPDRIDLADRYNKFEVNNFSSPRTNSMQGGRGVAIMPIAHPQTKGAQFAIWNDMTSFRGGYSEFDVYDRFKNMVALVSEKTWYGEKGEDQTGEEFVERFDAVGKRAPGANPGRVVESDGDLVVDIDFTNAAKDYSGNGYSGILKGSAVATTSDDGKDILKLDGKGSLALPFGSIGYPYTAKIDVKLDADTPANTLIFAGGDGELYANVDGTGHPGYKRGYHEGTQYVGYTFVWEDVTLPVDEWFTLALTCDQSNTTLYINGEAQAKAVIAEESRNNGFTEIPKIGNTAPTDSTTFILPVERIGENLKGELAGLQVYNRVLTAAEVAALSNTGSIPLKNVALNKTVTKSSLEVSDGRFTAEMAVDGIVSSDSRWSPNKDTSKQDFEAWLQVDLGSVYPVEEIQIKFETEPYEYEVFISEDGNDWTSVGQITGSVNGVKNKTQLFKLDTPTNAQYVKYVQTKQWYNTNNRYYGGSIYELEVYTQPDTHTVTFETNGGSAVEALTVADGQTAKKPSRPTKDGFVLEGWYADEALTQPYDFKTPVTADITIYAKWTESCTVTFETNGGNDIPALNIAVGDTAGRPADPTRSGYTFDGWYADEELTVAYDFAAPVAESITLYAKWTKKSSGGSSSSGTTTPSTTTTTETREDGTTVTTVTNPDGSKTETVEQPDGTKTEAVTTKDGDVTITVTDPEGEEIAKVELPAEIPAPETSFEDVAEDHWAKDAIDNMAALGLVNGVGENRYGTFSPMTRGDLATVLYRLSNGKSDYQLSFTDVVDGKYYAEGVAWAAKAGVVTGITAELYAPEQVITREQLAVMLTRYAKLIGLDTSADTAKVNAFTDGAKTGDWAVNGVAWCVEKGILQGKGDNTLDPTAQVSRAEVALMLDRFIALIK